MFETMFEILAEPETWVAVAFAIFVGIAIKLGAPGMIIKALDDRGARIRAELDEALRLRREAEAVLAQYRKKQKEAENEAEAIILSARGEAERLAAEAKSKVEDFIARRTKMAENKIAQAEAQALADVRAAAADAAVAAAERILVETTHGPAAEELVAQGIRGLKAKLN
jgi:F-type H+-transporting ATPase subunit b